MLGFVRGSCGNWLGWAGSEVADGYSKRARPVFLHKTVRNSKPQLPFQLPGGDVTSEGQGRGDAVTSPTWDMSEDAVQMPRNLTGTRQWRWVRLRQRRTAHKIQLHVIRSQRGARPGALMALTFTLRCPIQVASAAPCRCRFVGNVRRHPRCISEVDTHSDVHGAAEVPPALYRRTGDFDLALAVDLNSRPFSLVGGWAGWGCIWERRLRFAPTVRSDLASLDTAYPGGGCLSSGLVSWCPSLCVM